MSYTAARISLRLCERIWQGLTYLYQSRQAKEVPLCHRTLHGEARGVSVETKASYRPACRLRRKTRRCERVGRLTRFHSGFPLEETHLQWPDLRPVPHHFPQSTSLSERL